MLNVKMKFIALSTFFAISLTSFFCFAEEDGIDIFLKTIDFQQNSSKILSGKGSYDMTKAIAGKTEKEIQEEIDERLAAFKEAFPDYPLMEEMESSIPQAVKDQYSKKQTFSGSFRFDYSKTDYLYFENQLIFNGNSEKPVTVVEKRSVRQKFQSTESVMLDCSISQALVGSAPSSVADFDQFGRLRGLLAGFASSIVKELGLEAAREQLKKQATEVYGKNKNISILKIVETKPSDDGSTSYTLESSVDGKVTQRYVIVPSKGYICPKIELYDFATGNLVEKYESKEWTSDQRVGASYPTIYVETRYDASTGNLIEEREYKIDQATLALNETSSPADFSVDIPEGYKVIDTRKGKNTAYAATAAGVLSLEEDSLNLDKKTWLRRLDDMSNNPASSNRSLGMRIFLMAIGIGLVVLVLIRRFRKNKKQSLALFLFFF